MATAEWADYARVSRIKTARRRKRLVKKYKDKKILAMHRELHALYERERNLGYEELVPPIQRGWKRLFVLREEFERSRDAAFYIDLLKKINTVEYSHRRDFKKKKKRRGKKILVVRPQYLKKLYEWELTRLKLTERERMCFAEVIEPTHRRHEWNKVYVFQEPWRYRLKTEPNMITQVRVKDTLLEQEIDNLRTQLFAHETHGRWWKLTRGHRNWRSYSRKRPEEPKANYMALLRYNPEDGRLL